MDITQRVCDEYMKILEDEIESNKVKEKLEGGVVEPAFRKI